MGGSAWAMARGSGRGGSTSGIDFSTLAVMVLMVVLGERSLSLLLNGRERRQNFRNSLSASVLFGERRIRFAVIFAPWRFALTSPTLPMVPLTDITISPSASVVRGNLRAVDVAMNRASAALISPASESISPRTSATPSGSYVIP